MRDLEIAYPPGDRAVLDLPGVRAMFLASGREAVRRGTRGLAYDLGLFLGRPWGFEPGEVQVPVRLWYGDADTTVPLQMGAYLASQMRGSRLSVLPGEGHFLFIPHWGEILAELTAGKSSTG
jgi:pimeloyl-ACP methyl ester carboxylesterase